ncbi:MAG: phosphoribosylaminoimidazolesuccinocarboxamide synthase [Planctomycetota bacterium]
MSHEPYLGARIAPEPGLAHLRLLGAGKVRDIYELDASTLLFVTSDRISAFDVVFGEGVPNKGRVLTKISKFWFDRTASIVPNHLVTTDVDAVPGVDAATREKLVGRIMVVRRLEPTPIEWVVRGYLAGSGWKEYRSTGGLWGHELPSGLQLASKLEEPLLTPTTKDDEKDLPLTIEEARELGGAELFDAAHAAALALFEEGTRVLEGKDLILADTKFEFGTDGDGALILIDEALTPDSSRMWPRSGWNPGAEQPSYDKQILRDWLEKQPWDKRPPAPAIAPDVLRRVADRYLELCELLTGEAPEGVVRG